MESAPLDMFQRKGELKTGNLAIYVHGQSLFPNVDVEIPWPLWPKKGEKMYYGYLLEEFPYDAVTGLAKQAMKELGYSHIIKEKKSPALLLISNVFGSEFMDIMSIVDEELGLI